ncbi:hypothetical protein JW766_06610 [Candidatus Dojkabacteria bacterium]|nr:hypothetical protein [Candidatus Dojkabacteria bacterium]
MTDTEREGKEKGYTERCEQCLAAIKPVVELCGQGRYQAAYWQISGAIEKLEAIEGLHVPEGTTHFVYEELTDEQVIERWKYIVTEDVATKLYTRAGYWEGRLMFPLVLDWRILRLLRDNDVDFISRAEAGDEEVYKLVKQNPLLYRLFVELFIEESLHAAQGMNGGPLMGDKDPERDVTRYMIDKGIELTDEFLGAYGGRRRSLVE